MKAHAPRMINPLLAAFVALILLFGCAMPGAQSGGKGNANPPSQGYQPQENAQNPVSQPGGAGAPSGQGQPAEPADGQSGAIQPVQASIPSSEISYDANGWKIYGTLYPAVSKAPTTLVILVPGLGTTRDSYPVSFIESLHEALPNAMILAIDQKGVGKSANLGSWRDFDYSQFLDMRTDITSAKPYFVQRYPTMKQIYVVGASMGSTSALMAAAKEKWITKVAMISPGLSFNKVDITASGGLESYSQALLVTASSGDSYSAASAQQISQLTPESQPTLKIYPGNGHGTEMFVTTAGDDKPLQALLLEFLSKP